ncbi:hypothetical protein [Gilvimarinus algae]|uniref:Replication initiation factor n=1 Tax=Gilvimarinus algae TaxID=3058037 RepID=A0ABT8TID3_9GAMM|nr:hypothetical protein [Gilvimarinus sp. SDUM040014]MDO3383855.1 hypothetical protein [Gilvimarinus sp. SDUM040014]
MRYENKRWHREGSVFMMENKTVDLSGLRYLHSGVDTVKQLYNCLIRPDVLQDLQTAYEGSDQFFTVGGIDWLITRSSKASGYQFILKNLDIGFVVLLKSFYAEADLSASHLKIEVTPQTISEYSPEALTAEIDRIAALFCVQLVHAGVSVHIATDVKGLVIPSDFEARLVAKAKRQYKFNSISNAQIALNETAVIYGSGQSYTFGSAGALQFCVYDKTAEAIKSDKIGFWEGVWGKVPRADFDGDFSEGNPISEYEQGDTVHRIEARFHHSVINQFSWGTKDAEGRSVSIKNYSDLVPHLTALWQYALNNFRLQHSTSYIDPLWQSLIEDVQYFCPSPDLLYKRAHKPPSECSRRNVAFWLGNQIKLYSRGRFKPEYVVSRLLESGLQADLAHYFNVKLYGESEALYSVLLEFVKDKMQTHLLSGVAA